MIQSLRRAGVALATVAVASAAVTTAPAQSMMRGAPEPPRFEGFIVDLADDLDSQGIQAVAEAFGLELRYNSEYSQATKLMLADEGLPAEPLEAWLQRLTDDPRIEYAEPNYLYGIDFVPDDPRYAEQWHLKAIGLEQAWDESRGDGVVVAVIDTGVAYEKHERGGLKFHMVPDLSGVKFVPGYDFIHDDAHPVDDNGHGTHVAGTIAQATNNGVGTAGVAFDAKIMPLKVLSGAGYGSVSDIAEAVSWAADHGAKVINMSLGGPLPSLALQRAVTYARAKGVTVICAAGNSATSRRHFPAGFSACNAVASVGPEDRLAPYSNYGDWIAFAAPGGDKSRGDSAGVLQNTILRGDPSGNDYLWFQGTSMAAPHAAGVAALIIANGITHPDDVEKVLKQSAHPGGENTQGKIGAGVIDAAAAVKAGVRTANGRGTLKLALAAAMVLMLWRAARRRSERLEETGSAAFWTALVVAASGLFFLSLLPLGWAPGWANRLVQSSFAHWPAAFTVSTTLNPLLHSVLLPFVAVGLFLGLPKMRPALLGFVLGYAAHLVGEALFVCSADVAWIPGAVLDRIWLVLNGLLALALALLIGRRGGDWR